MTIKTLQQRAEIEAAIEGRTLCDQLQVTAERSGDAPALSDVGQSGTQTITWAQAREQALRLAAGFIALGLQPGERVALMLPNRSDFRAAPDTSIASVRRNCPFCSQLRQIRVSGN